MHAPAHKMLSSCGTATTAKTHHPSYRPAPLLLPVPLLLLLLLLLVSSLCALPVSASLQILRPQGLQHVVQHTSWCPYGPAEGSGRPFRGSLVWIPNTALCSSVDDVAALDEAEAYPKPVAHFGAVNYSDVEGAIGLFTIASDCPMLNQLFYVEAVLGVSGAVVHSPMRNHLFPPAYSMLLTAPMTHVPAVAVKEPALEKLRAVVVDKGVEVEVQLGWCTSEMFYS